MSPKLQKIYDFLYSYEQSYKNSKLKNSKKSKGGRPLTYSDTSFILFFMSMFLKGIFKYKKMERTVKKDFSKYGFSKPPSRKTIRRRFQQLPAIIQYMMPQIAAYCYKKVCYKTFNIKCLYSDKSIFRAKGGLWHKKDIKEGIVPHSSIDTDATWSFSPYHKWRFGYALLLIVNQNRFPVAVVADTGNLNEPNSIEKMIQPIYRYIGIIVGDAAYKVFKVIKTLFSDYNILLQVRADIKDRTMQWYRNLIATPQALQLYLKRKPSVEPTFALIKELFNLDGNKQLPYSGKKYVIPTEVSGQAFLLITAITVQIMAVYNFFNKRSLGQTFEFCELF